MSRSMNRATLCGNLGKDPEIRTAQSGKRIANLTLATTETWKDRNSGEQKEQTEWHRVVVFNDGLAGVLERYTRKGSKLLIEGKITTRKWTDQSGQERYTTEIVVDQFNGDIVLCDRPPENGGQQREERPAQVRQEPKKVERAPEPTPVDDDIPF